MFLTRLKPCYDAIVDNVLVHMQILSIGGFAHFFIPVTNLVKVASSSCLFESGLCHAP